jgi:hypothetical protein
MWHPFASLSQNNTSRSRPPRRRRAARPRLESLEGRVVLSAVFDSVLGVGSDTSALLVKDNAVDAAGNTYVTGILSGPTDFDPAVVRPDGSDVLTPRGWSESLAWPQGTSDAFVAKYAPDHSLVWARRMGSDFVDSNSNIVKPMEQGTDLGVDAAGNVFVTGWFYGQADFGPVTLTSAGNTDVFVTELDPNGSVLWAKSWGGATMDLSGDIAVDAAGNVVSVGTTATVYSDGSWTPNGFEVRKFSPTGAAVWSKRIANMGGSASGVTTDAAGNVFLCGEFSGTVDFNPDPKKANNVTGASDRGANGYVLKLTSSGSFGWVAPFVAKTAATPGSFIWFSDIAVDASGSIIVGGRYKGQVDFNPSATVDTRLPYTGDYIADGVVVKLSSGGALAWATPLGGAPVKSLAVDVSGSVYATGSFGPVFTPGFGLPAVTGNGGSDVFVTKLTTSGSVDWALTFGGASGEDCVGIALDAAGTIYLAGTYTRTTDFDPDPLATYELTNAAYANTFLLKLRQA